MQDKDEDILTSTDTFVALKKKIVIWKYKARSGNCIKEIIPINEAHVKDLVKNVYCYFPSLIGLEIPS